MPNRRGKRLHIMSLDSGMIVVILISMMYMVLVFGLLFYVKNDWCDLLFNNFTVSIIISYFWLYDHGLKLTSFVDFWAYSRFGGSLRPPECPKKNFHRKSEWLQTSNRNIREPMKICELPILARIDPKTQKTHAAAKKCCGWEKLAIYPMTKFWVRYIAQSRCF